MLYFKNSITTSRNNFKTSYQKI